MSEKKVYEAQTSKAVGKNEVLETWTRHLNYNGSIGAEIRSDFGAGQRVRITVEKVDPPDGACIGLPGVKFPLTVEGNNVLDGVDVVVYAYTRFAGAGERVGGERAHAVCDILNAAWSEKVKEK
jgi:hypothetical protein